MERMWLGRLRWRMRGAWMWPAFVALTVLDALVLRARPVAGEGTDLVGGLLLAALLNLIVAAVLAPLAGALLRRRRRDLPSVVAADYAGTTLLAAVTLALVVAGAVHHREIVADRQDVAAQAGAVRTYVAHHAPAQYRRNLARADTRRIDAELYRTCVPGRDPERALCMFVDTSQSPPGLRVDSNRETNASFVGRSGG
jgi:hypothetical protein